MSLQEITTELDQNFSNTYVGKSFPYLFVNPSNPAPLPVVVELLEEGSLPMVFEYQGDAYEVKRVDASPLNLLKLLQVYPFEIFLSEEKSYTITTTKDLLEVSKWMRQSS